MSQVMYLESVICVDTSELLTDEIYLRYSIDGQSTHRYPSSGYKSMNDKENNPWITNLELRFNNNVRIEIWDSDVTTNEFLGSHTYQSSDAPYTESKLITNSNSAARYVLVTGSKVR